MNGEEIAVKVLADQERDPRDRGSKFNVQRSEFRDLEMGAGYESVGGRPNPLAPLPDKEGGNSWGLWVRGVVLDRLF